MFSGCGICGVMAYSKSDFADVAIDNMISSMKHRGPNFQSKEVFPEAILGHARLSILDLSPLGNQPMKRDQFTIVTNGEVYNFMEIREELKSLGYSFQSNTDTEVILRSYQEWGEKCLDKFNGMFALAVWDEKKKEMFLARDRLGIKPLYYYSDDKYFIFASEAQTLMKSGYVPSEMNLDNVVHQIIATSFYNDPNGETLIKNVYSFPAASYLKLTRKKDIGFHKYWDFPENNQIDISEKELVDELHEVFKSSIGYRLISDVPVGAFLSGGLDSSLIHALVYNTHIDKKVSSITLNYLDGGTDKYTGKEDEDLKYSKYVANKYADKIQHHLVEVQSAEISIDKIDEIIDMALLVDDERLMSIDLNYRYVKDLDITVVLNGQGADEVMGGYVALPYFYESILNPNNPEKLLIKKFIENRTIARQSILNNKVLMNMDRVRNQIFRVFDGFSGTNLEKAHKFLIVFSLQRILLFEDLLSMKHSLECRVPFLDHNLVELIFLFPYKYNIDPSSMAGKMLMRKVAENYFSKDFVYRPKQTFPTHDEAVGKKQLLNLIQDNLSNIKESKILNLIFNLKEIEKILHELSFMEIWQILVLWRWEVNFNNIARSSNS